jgi:hypothetical protein
VWKALSIFSKHNTAFLIRQGIKIIEKSIGIVKHDPLLICNYKDN